MAIDALVLPAIFSALVVLIFSRDLSANTSLPVGAENQIVPDMFALVLGTAWNRLEPLAAWSPTICRPDRKARWLSTAFAGLFDVSLFPFTHPQRRVNECLRTVVLQQFLVFCRRLNARAVSLIVLLSTNGPSSSSTRWTLCAGAGPRGRTTPREGSRQSSWCRCRGWGTRTTGSSC